MMNRIFVQIASFCDPQLYATVASLFNNAQSPQALHVAIVRQFNIADECDELKEFKTDSRCSILNVEHTASKGTCWARHLCQQFYTDEPYTMQIDSHMRFAPNWDVELIAMLTLLRQGSLKPILTAYVPSYDPNDDPAQRGQEPWRMVFDKFTPEGAVVFLPETIPNWRQCTEPVRARFFSGHFAFTTGNFVKEVPYDPQYYFIGEEISMAVRAFTHGYDMFHPHKVLLWHEYTRNGRIKHWDVHRNWNVLNTASHQRNRTLLLEQREETNDKYGLGLDRTLRQYENFAGLLFASQSVQAYTLAHHEPPGPELSGWCQQQIYEIKLTLAQVPEKDYDFWAVAFHDAADGTLWREDVLKDELQKLLKPSEVGPIHRIFYHTCMADYWVVWPHSLSKGWCERLQGQM